VCVELYSTVLGKEQYVQRHDTMSVKLYFIMILCVLNCTVT